MRQVLKRRVFWTVLLVLAFLTSTVPASSTVAGASDEGERHVSPVLGIAGPNGTPDPVNQTLAQALDVSDDLVIESRLIGHPDGYGVFDVPLASLPISGDSFALISSGSARYAFYNDWITDPSNYGGPWRTPSFSLPGDEAPPVLGGPNGEASAGHDQTQALIRLRVPAGAKTVGVDLSFGSEEWWLYTNPDSNDDYRDSVTIELAETSSNRAWVASNQLQLDFPANVLFDEQGDIFNVKSPRYFPYPEAPFELEHPTDSGINKFTPKLTTIIPVPEGQQEITLLFSVFDVHDFAYDSVLLLDNLRFSSREEAEPITVVLTELPPVHAEHVQCPTPSEPSENLGAERDPDQPDPNPGQPDPDNQWFYVNKMLVCDPQGEKVYFEDEGSGPVHLMVDATYLVEQLNRIASFTDDGLELHVVHDFWEQGGKTVRMVEIMNQHRSVVFQVGSSLMEIWEVGEEGQGDKNLIRQTAAISPARWNGYGDGIHENVAVPVQSILEALGGVMDNYDPLSFDYHDQLTSFDFRWADYWAPGTSKAYSLRVPALNKRQVALLRNIGLVKYLAYEQEGKREMDWAPMIEIAYLEGTYLKYSVDAGRFLTMENDQRILEGIAEWTNQVLGVGETNIPFGDSLAAARKQYTAQQLQDMGNNSRLVGQIGENIAEIVLTKLEVPDAVTNRRLSKQGYSKRLGRWISVEGVFGEDRDVSSNGPDNWRFVIDESGEIVGHVNVNVKATEKPYVRHSTFVDSGNAPIDKQVQTMANSPDPKISSAFKDVQADIETHRLESVHMLKNGKIDQKEFDRRVSAYTVDMHAGVGTVGISKVSQRKAEALGRPWVSIPWRWRGAGATNLWRWMRGVSAYIDDRPPEQK